MAIKLTYHGTARPSESSGHRVDALRAQVGDAIEIADGEVAAAALASSGLYRIKASSDCVVRFDRADAEDASGGEDFAAGEKEVRWLEAGTKPAVDAAG